MGRRGVDLRKSLLPIDHEPGILTASHLDVEGSDTDALSVRRPLPHQERTDREASIHAVEQALHVLGTPLEGALEARDANLPREEFIDQVLDRERIRVGPLA